MPPAITRLTTWISDRAIAFEYLLVVITVLASIALWFNLAKPPINSNLTFNLNPWRQVLLSGSPFDPAVWPGSYTPPILGSPNQAYFGALLWLSTGNLATAVFLAILIADAVGGICLYYLVSIWLQRHRVPRLAGLIAIVAYSFDAYKLLSGFGTTDGYFSAGVLPPGDPAMLLVLLFFTFLTVFRSRWYALALGPVSVLALANFPVGTLTVSIEYVAGVAVLLMFWLGQNSFRTLTSLLRSLASQLLVIFGIVISANLYVLVPFVSVSGQYASALSSSSPAYAFSYGFDTGETLVNSLRLITNWAVFTAKAPPWVSPYLSSPLIVLLTWLLPVLALSSVMFLRKATDLLFYLLMLGAILLSASINSPAGSLFVAVTSQPTVLRALYNGETFTPLVLIFYCFFAPVGAWHLWRVSREALSRQLAHTRATQSVGIPEKANRARGSAVAFTFFLAIAILLIVSVYPMTTPNYGASAASGYPVTASLPSYYYQAENYLTQSSPTGPVMVFPEVPEFESNVINGSTWYAGLNPYPDLITNPSISSGSSDNSLASPGSQLSIPSFVYSLGSGTCATSTCRSGGSSVLAALQFSTENASENFVTTNESLIHWQVAAASDNVSFVGSGGSLTMNFIVNSSVYESNGHWLLGYLPHPEDYSPWNYALVSFKLNGTTPQLVQFGFHSFTNYSAGNGYYLGNFQLIQANSSYDALIPLSLPSIYDGGVSSNVTNLYFVDDSESAGSPVTLQVSQLRFISLPNITSYLWWAGNAGDSVTSAYADGTQTVEFAANLSNYEPNGHWAIGDFVSPVNLSSADYVIINYTLSDLNPAYLQFGYHSYSASAAGNGFDVADYLTTQNGENFTTIIPLDAPVILGGGVVSNVTNFYFAYTPPSGSSGLAYLNISSIRLGSADPTSQISLALDLDRLGVEFAYVDTSIAQSSFPTYVGDFYNQLFGGSPYFEEVFHAGTITIYRDSLYSGLFYSPQSAQPLRSAPVTMNGQTFEFAQVYYNESNANVSYITPYASSSFPGWTRGILSNLTQESATEFTIDVSSPGPSLLEMKYQYESAWTARCAGESDDLEHVEVDGFANGWIVPGPGCVVHVSLDGASEYFATELGTALIPVAMVTLLAVVRPWIRTQRHRS